MKTSGQPRTIAMTGPLGWETWWSIGILIGFLLCAPIVSHGQDSPPQIMNPHADMSVPALPAEGIIGVALHVTAERIGDPAGLFIRATHPEGPATKAGIAHGQEILAVDGTPIKGKTYREIVTMIRGEVGRPVRLTMKTFSEVRDITVTRVSEAQLLGERHS